MTPEEKEVFKEIAAEQEKISMAVIELQAIAQGKDPALSREVAAAALNQKYDSLRKKIDALQ